MNNEAIRQKLAEIQAEGKSDHEWWEQKRATIQSNFMKELDQDTLPPTTSSPGSGSISIPSVAGLQSASSNPASDEDTVLVEGGGPATSGSAKGGTARKRKGRK